MEVGFAAVFSAVVLCVFFSVMSMNGLVMGNDPAVHLEKALIFLQTGKIPLGNLGWTPPLYQIILATFISFTGAAALEQMIFLVKVVAVIIDWLLFFSVYLLGSKFFGRKVGAVATILLLMVVPIFELNLWGGYTTALGLAFMLLLFLYFPMSVRGLGYLVVTFLVAFSLVLSHQLATFVTILILTPIMLYMLFKSRGKYIRAFIALILGGGVAFFLYYFQAMIPYLGVLIEHVLLTQKSTLYQIPATTFSSFMVNFGFIFFLGIAGLFVAYFGLRKRKEPALYLITFLSFVVPFVLAESYLFGLFLPFQWFIYYLMPSMVILAAVSAVFAYSQISRYYGARKNSAKKHWLKIATVFLIILAASTAVFRFATVYGKVMEGSVYYSTSDLKALEAGKWLKSSYPENAAVVVTEIPGFWFRQFSGKEVFAATNPIVQRNEIAESVLALSYELENSLTLIRAYEAKGGISDEDHVSINHVWNRIAYSSGDGSFVNYSDNGIYVKNDLSTFNREIYFDNTSSTKKVEICYSNDAFRISRTVLMDNASYSIKVVWNLTSLESEVSDVKLYISVFFDLHFSFLEAFVPGVLNWENPWERPSEVEGSDWAVVNFNSSILTARQFGFYDADEKVIYALEFGELPDWGNVGALGNRQIDAMRFQCVSDTLEMNQTVSFDYRILAFSESSVPDSQMPIDLAALFELSPSSPLTIIGRNYRDYIMEEGIKFIVYDRNQLDTKIMRCRLLELVYSNDRYVIFKIKNI